MQVIYLPEIKRFVKNLDLNLKKQVLTLVEVLINQGHLLRMPYSKALGKGLFELRIIGKIQIRVFYCFHKNIAYLLHGVIKKNQKLHMKDVSHAREVKRLVEHL